MSFARAIAPDGPGRIGRNVPARGGVVENLAQDVQHPVRAAGRRRAVGIEPPHHHDAADSVESHRAEGGKQLARQCASHHPSEWTACNGRSRRSARGRRRTPGTGAACPERSLLASTAAVAIARQVRRTSSIPQQRHRTERDLPGARGRLGIVDVGAGAGRADAHAESADAGVPDRILAWLGPQPCDAGIGQALSSRHGAQPSAAENVAEGIGGFSDRGIGQVRVLQRRLRRAVSEQAARRRDGLALHDGDAGVGVACIVQSNVAQIRLGSHLGPERFERMDIQWPAGP